MPLSDEIAAQVLGELHQLTKNIEEQGHQLKASALVVKRSAEAIKTNSDEAVKNSKLLANIAHHEIAQNVNTLLSKSIADSIDRTSTKIVEQLVVKWALVGIALLIALLLTFSVVAYQVGNLHGQSDSWLGTPEGKLAMQLSNAGSLAALANCEMPGWKVKGELCVPYPTHEGTYGWRIHR